MAAVQTIDNPPKSTIKPPVASIGVVGWARANLFSTWYNSLLTIAVLILLWHSLIPFIRWALIDSRWFSTSQECQAADGACWSIIPANYRFMLFCFYPYDQ